MTNEAMAEAQWFVHKLTLAALKASVPDGEQEDAIKSSSTSLTHSLNHSLTWHVPAPHPASISFNRVSFL